MNKQLLTTLLTVLLAIFAASCSKEAIKEKAKSVTKSATEVTMSAAEGLAEAVNENGEQLSKLATDATGKIALGAGKSIGEQLDQHAADVGKVTGRTMVQLVDGAIVGTRDELKEMYTEVPFTTNKCEGVELSFIGKYRNGTTIDSYVNVSGEDAYICKFDCVDVAGNTFLTKSMEVSKSKDPQQKNTLSIASFGLSPEEEVKFKELKNINVTFSKK